MKKAVILFSGGLDSTSCLAYAKCQGFVCHALYFNYSQRHHAALKYSKVYGPRRFLHSSQNSDHINATQNKRWLN